MASPGLYVKLGLDFLFIVAAVVMMFVPVFGYMNGIKVYLVSITYSLGFVEVSTSDGSEVCNYIGITAVCETFERFIWAGVFYIIFLLLSFILAVLSLISLFSPNLQIRKKVFRSKIYHISYPLFYTIAFLIYSLESQVFSLPDFDLGESYQMKYNFGLFLMILLEISSISSLISFCSLKFFCFLDLQENLLK
jgi:hypothetical protein